MVANITDNKNSTGTYDPMGGALPPGAFGGGTMNAPAAVRGGFGTGVVAEPTTDMGQPHDSGHTHGGTAHHHHDGDSHGDSAHKHDPNDHEHTDELGVAVVPTGVGQPHDSGHTHGGTAHHHHDGDSHGDSAHKHDPNDHEHTDELGVAVPITTTKPKQAQRFTFYYSIAKDDVKFTPLNDDKGHHQTRAKEFKLFYTEKSDKLSDPIGTLKFIETVSFREDRSIESFLTNGHLDFFNIPSYVPIGEELGVTFKAFGHNDIKLSASQPGVSQTDTLAEAISKKRYGRVTGRPRGVKHPKLGDEATITISTFPGKDYKKVVVHLS